MSEKFTARAHGRVNLIGEHTDYNGGWVLPTTIPQYTEVMVEASPGKTVIITSSGDRSYSYNLGEETHTDSWVDYLQGATKLLSDRGEKLSGFRANIESNMPEGSGLSSSAALEISFLKSLKQLFNLNISDVELAKIGQKIENEFVGARVGIMDQMAVSLAKEGEALFLDTRELTYERVPLPLEKMDLLVINSGISHRLSAHDGGYNQRRAQCEEACKILGIAQLRDITFANLAKQKLPETLMNRARHVVTENERVKQAVEAIRGHNVESLGKLFVESHKSMRDDYEVSIPEIDLLVDLCLKNNNVYGARLTGGGFGGSIVVITKKGMKHKVAENIIPVYEKETGSKGTVLA